MNLPCLSSVLPGNSSDSRNSSFARKIEPNLNAYTSEGCSICNVYCVLASKELAYMVKLTFHLFNVFSNIYLQSYVLLEIIT